MNKPAFLPRDYLRPPVWNGQLALGKFTLNLSVSRDMARVRGRTPQSRIANRVAALRREYGLSRQELAHLLDIHPSTLFALEGGSYLPSLELALRLSAFFAQPVETIFSVAADENEILA